MLRSYPVSNRGVNIVNKFGLGEHAYDSCRFGIIGENEPGGAPHKRLLFLYVSEGTDDAHSSIRYSSDTLPLNQWTHVRGTWKTPGEIHLYADGVEKSGNYYAGTGQNTSRVNDNNQEVWIGRNELRQALNALVDEVKIFGSVVPVQP